MLLRSRLSFAGAAAVMALIVGCSHVPAKPGGPAEIRTSGKNEALKITLKDDGHTVKAIVGQEIVVSLEGREARTGWEVSNAEGKSVQPVKESGSVGSQKTPPLEFTPTPGAADEAMGTYTWRYRAVSEGETTLEYSYVLPGGPRPILRSASRLVRSMKVTIEVSR